VLEQRLFELRRALAPLLHHLAHGSDHLLRMIDLQRQAGTILLEGLCRHELGVHAAQRVAQLLQLALRVF
jgi:hypothetical protein